MKAKRTRRLQSERLESRTMLHGSPWQNPLDALDLNGDGALAPLDALLAVNALNSGGSGQLEGRSAPPALRGRATGAASEFLDANGDGSLSPIDALEVIIGLNQGANRERPADVSGVDQADEIGDDAEVLDISTGFAKACAEIGVAGDIDVFTVTPTESRLSVAIHAGRNGAVSVTIVDSLGEVVAAASTAGSDDHRPAVADAAVEAGEKYFIVVSADADVDADATGRYGLHVLNYTTQRFRPVTDAELGDDIHGGTDDPTALTLDHGHATVRSNIDAEGDTDAFSVAAVLGRLVVFGGSKDIGVAITVTDAAGTVVGEKDATERGPIVVEVAADASYMIAITATDGAATGAYVIDVINHPTPTQPLPALPPHDGGDDDVETPPERPTPEDVFAHLDADLDTRLTLEEFSAAPKPREVTASIDEIFARIDADGDGFVTLDEFLAATPPPPFPPPPPSGGTGTGTQINPLPPPPPPPRR